MNFYSFDRKGDVIGFGLVFCCSAAFYAFFSFFCGISHWRKRMREWVLWLQVSTGSCPSGHCITGSHRASVFLLTAKLYIKGKEGSRCSPYCMGSDVSELLSAHILQLLQRFSGSKRRLKYSHLSEMNRKFFRQYFVLWFFLWLDNKILLFLKMTPYESPPAAGLKFHTNCMKNNW